MINAIYGKKIGMTQLFDEDGKVIPVTVIEAAPNKVCQVKTTATDGYEAVQLGFGTIKEQKVNKPMAGHFAKQGVEPVRYLRVKRHIPKLYCRDSVAVGHPTNRRNTYRNHRLHYPGWQGRYCNCLSSGWLGE
mgnify:CR=1 FL=1